MTPSILQAAHLRKMTGFSYTEVLIATTLIAVALIPALEAMQPGIHGNGIQGNDTENHYLLRDKLEQVLAQPFTDLETAALATGDPTTPSSYSDSVNTPQGRSVNRQVFLSPYDGDNADTDNDPFTGTDDDLLWVRVGIVDTEQAIEIVTYND
jgi:type II secretory pathway pseudopilin PulG